MKEYVAISLLTLALGCGGGSEHLGSGKNILLITVDTTRADAISCLGGDPRATPHIDALAARSTLFTRAMSETNVTNPSHASMFSGLRAIHHGVVSNTVAIPEHVDTLPEALRREGYESAAFVAAPHLYSAPGWRGFDVFPPVKKVKRGRMITKHALEWLQERPDDRPFFLWAHYFDPHATYIPEPEDAELFYQGDPTLGEEEPIGLDSYFDGDESGVREWLLEWRGAIRDRAWPRAMYTAEVHAMDRQIGRLLDGLVALGMESSTIVVLASDHGESLGEHDIWYDHVGLFETQLHIPLMVHVPGLEPRRSDALVSTIDIAPTLEELLGIELRSPSDGLSLVPVMTGNDSPDLRRRNSFVHQSAHNNAVAVRADGWKLHWPVVTDHRHLPGTPQLFDLRADPGEEVDVSGSEPERVEAMQRLLAPWLKVGAIEKGDSAELSEDVIRGLRELGYADHIGG